MPATEQPLHTTQRHNGVHSFCLDPAWSLGTILLQFWSQPGNRFHCRLFKLLVPASLHCARRLYTNLHAGFGNLGLSDECRGIVALDFLESGIFEVAL